MKHQSYIYILVSLFLLLMFSSNFHLVKGKENYANQILTLTVQPNTVTVLPTARASIVQPTATNMPATESPCCRTTDQTIDLYKQALEVSQNTVDDTHATANLVLAVVGFVFTGIGLAIAGGTWLVGNTINRSTSQFEQAREQLATVQSKYEKSVEEFDKRNSAAQLVADELDKKQSDLRMQINNAEKILDSLQSEISRLKSSSEMDRQVLKKPLILAQIDDYGMQLVSGNTQERDSAVSALLEMSNRPDAVVRRKAVQALGALEEYNERVVKRLNDIVATDPTQGVLKEAEKSLKLIEAKKPKKTPRRKF